MLRYMTAGESHGKGLVAVIDGIPAGLSLDNKFINDELLRRMGGYGRGGRMKIEKDKANVFSGTRKGKTIGSPISLIIENRDYMIDKLPEVFCPRPGHADLAGMQKYSLSNAREVLERASARETAARVALGAVAKLLLAEFGIKIISHVTGIGDVRVEIEPVTISSVKKKIKGSKLGCIDKKAEKLMCAAIDNCAKNGDSLGGEFDVLIEGVPPGLGSYVQWDRRLDGALAKAVMSIQAVKAVSIGDGINNASSFGSEVHDPISYNKKQKKFLRTRNNSGGIEGGVTNGEQIQITGFMKPIATLMKPLDSVNIKTKKKGLAATERADTTAVTACGVVGEAVVAIEVARAMLEKFGCDSMTEMKRNYKGYISQIKNM